MSEIGTFLSEPNNINQEDVDRILPRNITKLDLSRTQMNFINVSAVVKTLFTLQTI
jgi:hypothetical protein